MSSELANILKTTAALLIIVLVVSGCGKPAQEIATPPPEEEKPRKRYGIFHGEWRWRHESLYSIDHPLGKIPAVTICSNEVAQTVIKNVAAKGRTMTFDQYDSEPEALPTFELGAPAAMTVLSSNHWEVVMRIAINDPNNLLLEKTCSGLIHKQLLTRFWPEMAPIIRTNKLTTATNTRPAVATD